MLPLFSLMIPHLSYIRSFRIFLFLLSLRLVIYLNILEDFQRRQHQMAAKGNHLGIHSNILRGLYSLLLVINFPRT